MDRYSRQVLFAELGSEGQRRIRASHVLIVGCGALGSLQAEMLARAGVGALRIADRDFVEESNLQRQTLFTERDARERVPKAVACVARLREINSEVEVEGRVLDVNQTNIEDLIRDCDLVLDGTDNFLTRYLINDACVKQAIPWIYGAAVGSYGVTMTVRPHETPCLRCLFPEMPAPGSAPTCDTAGIIMPAVATVVAVQVAEALKLLTGNVEDLHGAFMQFDLWRNEWRSIKLGEPSPECPACASARFPALEAETGNYATVLCGRQAVQVTPINRGRLNLAQLFERFSAVGEAQANQYLIRLRVDGYELTVFEDGRAIIRGTEDLVQAQTLYARYVGS
ncbi:ThiF family adenylyltransferase [Pyrinomonas methylaliphatogenes]|uniref:Dinucleotide-utilizing enzyme possibly involved in molybdopterin or thiamin biosynthesis n=1 Tax=Pyrinomonas methylaliphatogenes TaxID=454194 RepID=A0A0B6WVF9_9BACT|nr:ThiF family adenylyltransferase [Pyrinomonas methylaliphatogenes]MBX5478707.1 ThiF family adenylyltransferase [Pyrinomonas methylaliphatogenes]CDM64274.1 dinucleotide-utilizing enzyme possibly involved in molybdopterin or thiamin biosynthesis [Pyrinomonas methylaliphatogenes]